MVINVKNKRLDIKEIAISNLEKRIGEKCICLKTDNICFETPIGNIISANYKYGYFTLVSKEGKTIFPKYINGYNMVKIIDALNRNKFFSYIETKEGKHIKVRLKNKKSD